MASPFDLGFLCQECVNLVKGVPLALLAGALLSSVLGILVLGYLFLLLAAPVPRPPLPEEKLYQAISEDGSITKPQQLPCWRDQLKPDQSNRSELEKPSLFMSVVIPAYNEQDRLSGMLEEAVHYLEHSYGALASLEGERGTNSGKINPTNVEADGVYRRTRSSRQKENGSVVPQTTQSSPSHQAGWEILIVSDGSTDKTVETALSFARDHQLSMHPESHAGPWTPKSSEGVHIQPGTIRVVQLKHNRGKGGAVTHGMRHVRGQYVVFADADGASKFNDLGKLVAACQEVEDAESRAIAVGSRAHLVGSDAVVKRSKLRNFLMHSFHIALRLLTPPATARIRDTQCGFKLFSRATLPYIIPYMHSEGWIFDVEMLMLAEFAGIPVTEVPVGWKEVSGSKLSVVWDSLGMAWGLAMLRAAWGVGVYSRAGA
ncbi:dolichyl-phosphate beta-glucosyltransferase [Myotisia sp. PD_48]|nr:dolichyl-phosphate beta-glucosyltransferase [Myotisia sp. PD_48]